MTHEFVDLAQHLSGLSVDARYSGPHNFMGRPAQGYLEPLCLLTTQAARRMGEVRGQARALGLDLLVFDGYRPQRAVDDFLRWVETPADARQRALFHPRVNKADMIRQGYIAPMSSHSRGSSIDLTLVRRGGERAAPTALDMGTPFDFFDTASHTFSREVSPQARENRMLLRRLMHDAGFRGIDEEWWHFTLEDEPFPSTYFDFPVTHVTSNGSAQPRCAAESECSHCPSLGVSG